MSSCNRGMVSEPEYANDKQFNKKNDMIIDLSTTPAILNVEN